MSLIQPDTPAAVARVFRRRACSFTEHSAVFQAASERMLERLSVMKLEPEAILDLGCRDGFQAYALAERFPNARIVGVDFHVGEAVAPPKGARKLSKTWWKPWQGSQSPELITADPHQLPLESAQFDIVISNLLLPWCAEPQRVFDEAVRVLKPQGALLFTSAGPDTLQEYRRAWETIDTYEHSFGLVDMHDIGDALLAAGLSAPVLDRELISVNYPNIAALQAELRAVGAGNLATGRRKGLMNKRVTTRLDTAAKPTGKRFATTLELVHGHGWKGDLPTGRQTDEGYTISLDSFTTALRK
ncbi:MAG: methyltransferase domain-containing protein [Granulosicoccaceae bacterium]